MTDRTKLTLLTLGGFALVFASILATGCHTKQPESPIETQTVYLSDDAAADVPPSVDPPPVVQQPELCDCSTVCRCAKGQCLCAVGQKCRDACNCQAEPDKKPVALTPFWCPACKGFSYYMAPADQVATKCAKCGKRAVRTKFQKRSNQGSHGPRKRLFEGAYYLPAEPCRT